MKTGRITNNTTPKRTEEEYRTADKYKSKRTHNKKAQTCARIYGRVFAVAAKVVGRIILTELQLTHWLKMQQRQSPTSSHI